MVVVGTGTASSQYLKRQYPNTEGLEAGSTKQEGTKDKLEFESSYVEDKELIGMG